MAALVLGQGCSAAEAARAGVRPLGAVHMLVFEQARAAAEVLPTLLAAVGLRRRVGAGQPGLRALVHEVLRVCLVVEALPAVSTFPWGLWWLLFSLHTLLIPGGGSSDVGAHVAVQVRAPGEGPPALGALEGLLAGVDAAVPLQVRAPSKGLTAHTALEGLPAQVALLVPGQRRGVGEAAAALGAAVRRCGGGAVRAPVREQRGADAEAAPALGAAVGPLARVHAPVDGEVGALDEALPAVGTHVRAVATVDFLVLHQG